jgi:hypothetical protein
VWVPFRGGVDHRPGSAVFYVGHGFSTVVAAVGEHFADAANGGANTVQRGLQLLFVVGSVADLRADEYKITPGSGSTYPPLVAACLQWSVNHANLERGKSAEIPTIINDMETAKEAVEELLADNAGLSHY